MTKKLVRGTKGASSATARRGRSPADVSVARKTRPSPKRANHANQPTDPLEAEARRAAGLVDGNKPGPTTELLRRSPSPVHHARGVTNDRAPTGRQLPVSQRQGFESFLGISLEDVRIHTDPHAAAIAETLRAEAFTFGSDVYFRTGRFAPESARGRSLLAHEMAHVLQSHQLGSHPKVLRQEIPFELQTSVDHSTMSEEELQFRYDLIAQTLLQFDQSTAETYLLEEEAGQIGVELSRRAALAAGRTFTPEAIERMRSFFTANATSASPLDCITCMNQGVRDLLAEPAQPVGSTVQGTMGALQASARAGPPRVIEFNDAAGKLTTGTRRPDALGESVWDAVIQMSAGDVGWSVFGMSLLDGYHSVTLTLDNNDPTAPKVFWSDQFTGGGWRQFDRGGLDTHITQQTQRWWDPKPADKKQRTRVTLWRLSQ